jgi:hypothetical protein
MVVVDRIEVQEVDREEGWKILEQAAQRDLRMTARQFLDAWYAGRFADEADTPEVIRVAMLIPFVQPLEQ